MAERKYRYYELTFWDTGHIKRTEVFQFEDIREAHKWCYRMGYRILAIKFAGWK